jgi:2,4-dienoyl-CoA reductase-like NADH-dependent reductase (Old Yellow Enzyme family)
MASNKSIRIKDVELKSKFFFAPINTGLALNGNPTDELISFHSLRSNEYTGINYVGNVAIDIETITNKNTLFINPSMDKYSALASEIKKKGSVAGVQIACFKSKFQAQRNWKNALTNDYIEFVKTEIKNLSLSNIKEVIKSFQNGIRKLVELGFEAIQIHGAHGYFLNNFLSETFNSRTDEFGKDRTLILKEILNGIDSLLSQTIIDLRISVFEESFETELTAKQFSFLESIYKVAGIDIISVSNGIYNLDKKLIYPVKTKGVSFMLDILSDFIKTHNAKVWNLSGNVRNIAELIEQNSGITFSIGRSIIADQDFLKKHFENRTQEIVECDFKNQCHYFTLQKEFIECGVNKRLY